MTTGASALFHGNEDGTWTCGTCGATFAKHGALQNHDTRKHLDARLRAARAARLAAEGK